MPDNVFCKLLFRRRNYAKHRITRQEKRQPTALQVDATDLTYTPLAYRPTRMTAIRIGWPVTACGRSCEVTNGSFVAAKLTEGPRVSLRSWIYPACARPTTHLIFAFIHVATKQLGQEKMGKGIRAAWVICNAQQQPVGDTGRRPPSWRTAFRAGGYVDRHGEFP